MSADTAARVHYFDKQFLRVDEFRDEQLYQLALRRRHNNTQHTWGILRGLEIENEDGSIVVQPGFAIDGYGRELLLTAKLHVAPETFDDLGTDRLDLWLIYDRQDDESIPEGYGECGSSKSGSSYRSTEIPRLLSERPRSNTVDPRRPPGVPDDVLDAALPPISDDPQDTWRVYLGRVIRLETGELSIDGSRRPYAGVVAETIDHPANPARVEVGRDTLAEHQRTIGDVSYVYKAAQNQQHRRFGVFVAEDVGAPQMNNVELSPRIEILDDGTIGLHGRTVVHGNLRLFGGAVQFVEPLSEDAELPDVPSMYRFTEGGNDELRIDLGSDNTVLRKFVIGFSKADGTFTPCLTVELTLSGNDIAPVITINGDLRVNGTLDGTILPVMIGPEAMAAIRASFQAGLNEGNNPT